MTDELENVKEKGDFQEEIQGKIPTEERISTSADIMAATDVSSRALLIKRMPGAEKIYHKFRGEIL
jgi:hypothetical protein